MTDSNDNVSRELSPLQGFSGRLPVLAGVIFALLVYCLLTYIEQGQRSSESQEAALNSLESVRTVISGIWDNSEAIGLLAARQIAGADKARISSTLASFRAIWPNAGFSVYNRDGEFISLSDRLGATSVDPPPMPHTVRGVVHKALIGENARAYTRVRGFVGLSTAVPVRGGLAAVLVISLPMDTYFLQHIKKTAGSDIAVLPFMDVNSSELSPVSHAVTTFPAPKENEPADMGALLWEESGKRLSGKNVTTTQTFASDSVKGLSIAFSPLSGPDGNTVGALIVAPDRAPSTDNGTQHFLAALVAGLAGALMMAWCMQKRGERLAASFAEGVNTVVEDDKAGQNRAWKQAGWPTPLEDSFEKIASSLRKYRIRARNAERALQRAGVASVEDAHETLGQNDFLRLFANVPVGVFQTDTDGRFLRVNTAFALQLGYDSPASLLEHSPFFGDFCLYAEGLRNPLTAFLSNGQDRHIISLRRADGKVRHFSLRISALTSSNGESSGVIEGFMRDRELNELVEKAERERDHAIRQHASLALLLAATCRQTRTYLEVVHTKDRCAKRSTDAGVRPLNDGDQSLSGATRNERRKSVISVNSILQDIHQIALSEAESSPPALVPIEFERFFQTLSRQVLPGMYVKGISLRCEVAEDIPMRLNGPVSMLRHVLERGLLAVTSPVSGGDAVVSMMRDPNAPKSPGMLRVVFSVSWSRFSREVGEVAHEVDATLRSGAMGRKSYVVAYEAPANEKAVLEEEVEDTSVLDISDEQKVISYLAQRMRGEFLESLFTKNLRSIRIIVPLSDLVSDMMLGESSLTDDILRASSTDIEARSNGDDVQLDLSSSQLAPVEVAALVSENLASYDAEVQLGDGITGQDRYDPDNEAAKGSGLDLLLVDSSLNNRLLFSLFLRDTHHRITEAHDGQDGIEAFKSGKFDVVFMDMEMPLMDGYQATRIIRALEADAGLKPTPIIAMTAYALPEFRQRCMISGCTDLLSKPFSKVTLMALLDAYVQMKQDSV